MTAPAQPWPEVLAGTPAVAVIERAITRGRLAHCLLITGDDHDTLVSVAHAIADRLLNPPGTAAAAHRGVTAGGHPDLFTLRPTGKMRLITAEAARALIGRVQVTASVGPRKVAILHECDRMNPTAANILLKTLEEPPASTTLLLLTTHPYALLATIRSRCLHFRFPGTAAEFTPDSWPAWLTDYQSWLGRLRDGVADKRAVADSVLAAYGLTARFGAILEAATNAAWSSQRDKLPPDLSDDEQTAIETGIANGLRTRLFASIEQATRSFALPHLQAGDAPARRALAAAVGQLEHNVGLLRLNLNSAAVLESFLLASLRVWAARA